MRHRIWVILISFSTIRNRRHSHQVSLGDFFHFWEGETCSLVQDWIFWIWHPQQHCQQHHLHLLQLIDQLVVSYDDCLSFWWHLWHFQYRRTFLKGVQNLVRAGWKMSETRWATKSRLLSVLLQLRLGIILYLDSKVDRERWFAMVNCMHKKTIIEIAIFNIFLIFLIFRLEFFLMAPQNSSAYIPEKIYNINYFKNIYFTSLLFWIAVRNDFQNWIFKCI